MEATKSFDPYEVIGIITPGTVLTLLFASEAPVFRSLLGKDGLSIGDFGLFVLIAFVFGHLLQTLGNMLEFVVWPIAGLPTNRVRTDDQTMLTPAQRNTLQARVSAMEGVEIDIAVVDGDVWRAITTRAYARVLVAGRSQRIDISNRTYGLCRGLTAAILICLAWYFYAHQNQHEVIVILLAMLGTAVWRMRRAGLHYARALFLAFIDLDTRVATTSAA